MTTKITACYLRHQITWSKLYEVTSYLFPLFSNTSVSSLNVLCYFIQENLHFKYFLNDRGILHVGVLQNATLHRISTMDCVYTYYLKHHHSMPLVKVPVYYTNYSKISSQNNISHKIFGPCPDYETRNRTREITITTTSR